MTAAQYASLPPCNQVWVDFGHAMKDIVDDSDLDFDNKDEIIRRVCARLMEGVGDEFPDELDC
jgi:hypothetical protein